MLVALVGVLLLGAAVAVIALFVRWEREGKEQLVPLVLLGLLVVEGTIYGDPNMIPRERVPSRLGLRRSCACPRSTSRWRWWPA